MHEQHSTIINLLVIHRDQNKQVVIAETLYKTEFTAHVTAVDTPLSGLQALSHDNYECVFIEDHFIHSRPDNLLKTVVDNQSNNSMVIVLSESAQPDLERNLLQAGAFDCMTDDDLIPAILRRTLRFAMERLKYLRFTQEQFRQQVTREAYIVNHDSLTGLANKSLFFDRLTMAIETCKRFDEKLALLYINFDGLKVINTELGHDAGDMVVLKATQRLKRITRKTDTLARLSGDEFVIMLTKAGEHNNILVACQKVFAQIADAFEVHGHKKFLTASVGIVLCPDDGSNPTELLKYANMAMQLAKKKGTNIFQVYQSEISTEATEKFRLLNDLRSAIEHDQIKIYGQTQHNTESGTLCGIEILSRWQHPDLGSVPPETFIALAEETGFITVIGNYVLQKVHQLLKTYHQVLSPGLDIAINVSPKQLLQPSFEAYIIDLLANSPFTQFISLEITENCFVNNSAHIRKLLYRLQKIGLSITLDDFGTGYSCLSYLKQLPIATLKIDKSFVCGNSEILNDPAIVNTIISLAHNLGIRVIAEGVETQEQLESLKQQHCDAIQGYYFSQPAPLEDIFKMVSKNQCSG